MINVGSSDSVFKSHFHEEGPDATCIKYPDELPNHWRHLVRVFTHLNFSFNSDRLPAITGIASSMQQLTSAQYNGGLWSDDLVKVYYGRRITNPGVHVPVGGTQCIMHLRGLGHR